MISGAPSLFNLSFTQASFIDSMIFSWPGVFELLGSKKDLYLGPRLELGQ